MVRAAAARGQAATVQLSKATWPYEGPYADWSVLSSTEGSAITCHALNERLTSNAPIEITVDPPRWRPAEHIDDVRALVALEADLDEPKIRLSSDLLPDSGSVRVSRTTYSAFLVTNHTAAAEWRRRGVARPLVSFEDDFLIGGCIPTLGRSAMSNHVGVDVLAIQRDRMILVRQSPANVLSGGLLAPSGSGSADWADTHRRSNLLSVVRAAMVREMTEELGLSASDTERVPEPLVIGYARVTHLGGKPQFYGVCRLPALRHNLRGLEQRYTDDHIPVDLGPDPSVDAVLLALREARRAHARELSFPLWMLLTLTERWIERQPDAAARHLRMART